MRTRSLLPALVLASMVGGVVLPAQEMTRAQIANWPAPAFWRPPASHASGDRARVAEGAISSPMPFVPITPCRMLDTRSSGGAIASTETRDVTLTGPPCGIPSYAAAVSANFAVFDIITSANGFLKVWPTGSPSSSQAMVNWSPTSGQIDNASAVPLGTGGAITVQPNQGGGTIDLVIDVNGYYAGAGAGPNNTFLGSNAGNFTMTGADNTGIGVDALASNTTGIFNTATGTDALGANTTGNSNTATGTGALQLNTTGSSNTATGNAALENNTTGNSNTAIGDLALISNNIGSGNTATGYQALEHNNAGNNNIAIGNGAGFNLTTGSNNIDIGHPGVGGESNTIRIGSRGTHGATYIAGIDTAFVPNGAPVYILGDQLGTFTSSRRFKKDIRDIAEESDGLMRLRPVAFKYKREIDPTGLAQYGLIAEEVAEVYPNLVALDREGRPETVRYHLINALLVNEVQKQRRSIESQQAEIEKLKADLSALRGLVNQR